jgi:hypothetical protein
VGSLKSRYFLAALIVASVASVSPLLQRDRVREDAAARAQVEGRMYVLESADGFTAEPDSPIYIRFHYGYALLYAGCGMAEGHYSIVDGELILSDEYGLGSWVWDYAPCKRALGKQNRRLERLFWSPIGIEVEGDRLAFTKGSVRMTFLDRTVSNIALPLIRQYWRISSVFLPIADSEPRKVVRGTIWFSDGDGVSMFQTTCPDGEARGRYYTSGDLMLLGDIAYDRSFIGPSPSPCAELEEMLRNGFFTYEVKDRTLTMKRDGMVLTAESE